MRDRVLELTLRCFAFALQVAQIHPVRIRPRLQEQYARWRQARQACGAPIRNPLHEVLPELKERSSLGTSPFDRTDAPLLADPEPSSPAPASTKRVQRQRPQRPEPKFRTVSPREFFEAT